MLLLRDPVSFVPTPEQMGGSFASFPSRWLLARQDLHIWLVDLAKEEEQAGRYYACLSQEEKQRFHAYRRKESRQQFAAMRGALRHILAGYLDQRPDAVQLGQSEYGKPYLEDASVSLTFNLSHSDRYGVIALCAGYEIGADIEYCRPQPKAMALAKRFFAPEERLALEQCAKERPEQLEAEFFTCWTLKEAFIKALGDGLAQPLEEFAVSWHKPQAELIRWDNGLSKDPSQDWSLFSLSPAPSYKAAIAVQSGSTCLAPRLFHYRQDKAESISPCP